ncbi:MAG: serine hydrolase [Alphaproteobacteria bacterium]|nr:serine hydrolase [Alphaproteobacteria bacterium]MBV9862466.1 serine hydrolase [Alphaproteobacteria bacterium]
MTYVPPPYPQPWEYRDPADAGLDPARLAAAVRHAAEHETPWPRDLARIIATDFADPPPWDETLGEAPPRGGPCGLILRGGHIVAEWGDIDRADLTFSVAKSYLSILAGLAVERGLIGDVHDPVRLTVDDGGFDPPHNDAITWHHLLQQTSEWEGTLWDKPDLVDRNRVAGGRGGPGKKGTHRDLQPPGQFWEYNDVRINRLSLALLRVWRRPLPEVFRELVMDPIGASPEWRWTGYRNSWVEIDGKQMQSVAGGSHWGGGICISARDQARVGLLLLRRGMWGNRRVLGESWLARALQPCELNPDYGYLFWLNTGRGKYPAASASSFYALGAGGNLTWIDPEHDLVAILRWTAPAAANAFMELVGESLP